MFDHYPWSYASRVLRSGRWISEVAQELTESHCGSHDIHKVISAVDDVLNDYQDVQTVP